MSATATADQQRTEIQDPVPSDLPPSFDIVRVGDDGVVVAAGRAAPDRQVLIYRNGQQIDAVPSNKRGEWVWVPGNALPPGNHALQLRVPQDVGPAAISEPIIVLGPPVAADGAAPEAGTGTPTIVALGQPDNQKSPPRILQRDLEPTTDSDDAATPVMPLSLDSVQYGTSQPLSLAGTGPVNGRLSIVLDGDRLGQVLIDGSGNWQFATSRIMAPGNHMVDLALNGGAPQSYPFTIDLDEDAEATSDQQRVIVIVPGTNLWRIAEATYGNGLRYTLIFQANQDKISDPDIIYPGQVFTLPTSP
jgi:nucleoid-associated protein YgaU